MENKITIGRLAAMLAIATGKQKKLCEDFLKEIFRIVADELGRGESVRIKGFGTFKLVGVESRKSVNVATGEEQEIPSHSRVMFVAAKELASAVNRPFEAFEAVEISDDLTTDQMLDDLPDEEVEEAIQEDTEPVVEIRETVEEISEPVPEPEPTAEPEPVSEPTPEEEPEPEAEPESEEEPEPAQEKYAIVAPSRDETPEEYVEDYVESEPVRSRKFLWGMLVGFLAAAVVAAICFYIWILPLMWDKKAKPSESTFEITEVTHVEEHKDSVVDTDTVAPAVNVHEVDDKEVATRPSDEKVYDTISTTRFLTTMAQEHYGNFNLWPVIYEENKDIIGHPDRIKPGTKVVVPPLSKYGVDPNNPADVKKIKRKGIEIYARYK